MSAEPYSDIRGDDGAAWLADVRRSLRDSAREVEGIHLAELDRVGAIKLALPPPLKKAPARHGGGYRSKSSGYDWFYALSKAEQSRLRSNWMEAGRGLAPDELGDKMSVDDWLEHTRAIDGSRALGSGRNISANRYGGLNPNHLIEGAPYDVRVIWGDDAGALKHLRASAGRHRADTDGRVQFFTDKEGIVHPIRASYEHSSPAHRDYGDDLPF